MAKLIYWQPLREIDSVCSQLNRLFDELSLAGARPFVSSQETPAANAPAVELQDTGTAIILRAEVPGVEAKDLDVRVSRQADSLAGEYRQPESQTARKWRSEFQYGSFRRQVELPEPVRNDRLQAEFKNGILTLTLPKLSATRPEVVKVRVAEAEAEEPIIAENSPDSNPPAGESRQAGAPMDAELLEDVWASHPAA
jgi:HSP20 family protein